MPIIYNDSGSPTYSFDNVRSLFANDDYTYVNLETTLTTSNDRFKDKTY
ncbi:MAG: CapA family protein, partial [Spirochaetales bacterium]|nr:CapA family protein [Spirochaetales bacterium]